jgi:hypothetical protein
MRARLFALGPFLAAALVLTPSAAAAPVPLKHNVLGSFVTPDQMAGEWLMRWGHISATTVLTREGGYCCIFAGQEWVGSWFWDPKGNLVIVEARRLSSRHQPPAETFTIWTVQLQRDHRGRLDRTRLVGQVSQRGLSVSFELRKKR